MEEGLHAEVLDDRVLEEGDEERVAVLGDELAQVGGCREGVQPALDRVEVVHLVLFLLNTLWVGKQVLSNCWFILMNSNV